MSFWPSLRHTDERPEHEILREAVLVEIDECGETLSRLCTELLRGADTRVELKAALAELAALLERLDALDVSR